MSQSSKDNFLCAYAAVGDDALKRNAVANRLRSRLQAAGDISFNCDEFDGEVASGLEVLTACNTLPFASPWRLVHLKSADKLRKADIDVLVDYLKKPCETTILLIEAEKLLKTSRLYKAVSSCGSKAIIDCSLPSRARFPALVRSMAVSHGITLTDGAARLLVELVGFDTLRIDAELSKIALSHLGADAVNEYEVSSLVSRTTEVKPWEFLDALSAGNLARCCVYLKYMKSSTPYALIALCTGRIRELICAKALDARGASRELASVLGKKDWQVKHHCQWAARYSKEHLRASLIAARDAEQAMKSGSDPDAVFYEWMLGFLRPSSSRFKAPSISKGRFSN